MSRETKKKIPFIKTKFIDLKGKCKTKDGTLSIDVEGQIYLDGITPQFKGKGDFSQFAMISEIPGNMILELSDGDISVTCEGFWINSMPLRDEFVGTPTVCRIKQGCIKDTDDIAIYSLFVIPEIGGATFDENGSRCINSLDYIENGARLYSTITPDYEHCNAYSYIPMKYSRYTSEWNTIITKLQYILRFITANYVSSPYSLIHKDDNNYEIELFAIESLQTGSGIFYLNYPNIVSNFLQTSWVEWDNLIPAFPLNAYIDYYVIIANLNHYEGKMIVSCVLMEAIKHDFAKNYKGYTQDSSDFFLKPTGGRFSFKELVQEVYNQFAVTSGDLSFIRYRNEVIHQGKISIPTFSAKYAQFLLLISSIEKIFLNMFNYKGQIWNRFDEKWEEYS